LLSGVGSSIGQSVQSTVTLTTLPISLSNLLCRLFQGKGKEVLNSKFY